MRQINMGLFSSASDEWETPQELFDRLNDEFHFTIDVCATEQNKKVSRCFTREQDGLKQDWTGETVWCNPPYGRSIKAWIHKAYNHFIGGGTAVLLLPARTDTGWFHEYIYGKAEVRFLRGRVHFNGSKWNAPFPSIIVVYRGEAHDKRTRQHP